MSRAGGLGLIAGGGQALAHVGDTLMKDELENLRQAKLAKIQDQRDDKQFVQKKELQEDSQAHEAGLLGDKQDWQSGENELDRENKMDIAKLETDAKDRLAKIKAGKENQSADDKKYLDMIKRWKENNQGKEMDDRTRAMLYSEAFGIGERLQNQATNEVTFTGIDAQGNLGVTGEYVRPEGGSRRDRVYRNVEPPAEPTAAPAEPRQAALPDPAKYARVKGDYSKYPDGEYNQGQVKVINGVAYKLK